MNSSAFSCALRSGCTQPVGHGMPRTSPDETWRSLYTTRPHFCSSGAGIGALNERYSTAGVFPANGFVIVIHCVACGFVTESMLCFDSLISMSPGVVEAPTLTSQSFIAFPFGKLSSTLPVTSCPGS